MKCTSHPAYEDGTDRVFRNVVIQQSDVDIQPMKMEQIECSETSAYNNLTPGKYPKEYIQVSIFVFPALTIPLNLYPYIELR